MNRILLSFFALLPLLAYTQTSTLINDASSQAYFEIADHTDLDFDNELTVEAWIKVDSIDHQNTIIQKAFCGNYDGGYFFTVKNGKLKFGWSPTGNCNSNGHAETDDAVIIVDRCTHVAVTFSQTDIKFYVDGALVNSTIINDASRSIYNNNESLKVGAYKSLSGNIDLYFYGEMDELRIWNYERSEAEISANYNTSLTSPPNELIVYYRFNNFSSGDSFVENVSVHGNSFDGNVVSANTNYPQSINSCAQIMEEDVSIEENTQNNNFSIYPNPTDNNITVSCDSYIETIQILSLDGRVVLNKKYSGNYKEVKLNIENLVAGSYSVILNNNRMNKFVKL